MKQTLINVIVSIAMGLLSVIAGSMVFLVSHFIQFAETNSNEHSIIEKTVAIQKSWTENINTYVISPNTKRSKANSIEIIKIKRKIQLK